MQPHLYMTICFLLIILNKVTVAVLNNRDYTNNKEISPTFFRFYTEKNLVRYLAIPFTSIYTPLDTHKHVFLLSHKNSDNS